MNVMLLEVIALVGATVHTMEPAADGQGMGAGAGLAAPLEGATVLVEEGIIQGVGVGLEIPEGAEVTDLTGLHLIPGLIDGSVTFSAEHDLLYLDAGVTTVRDAGSPVSSMIPEASPGMRDRQPGPSLQISTPMFATAGQHTRGDAFLLGEPAEAARQIAELVDLLKNANASVDYFLFEPGLAPPQHAVVCAAAEAYGVAAWGPLPEPLDPKGAREAGQYSLVGLDSLLDTGVRFENIESDTAFERWSENQVAALAKGGWRVAPLLMGTARITRTAALEAEPESLAALGGAIEVAWRADIETFGLLRAGDMLGPVHVSLERQRAVTGALHRAGVQLVPASGAPSGGIAPGSGLIDELEEWTLAGVPAAEVLALATAKAADALGVQGGRIRAELPANLVACASDPLRSVDALRKPEVVIVRGKVMERFALDEAVAALKKRQGVIRDQRARPIALDRAPMPEGKALLEGTADLMTYGARTGLERYSVVETPEGEMAYGARIRILGTGSTNARELTLVQFIKDNLVTKFDMTLTELDASGEPILGENDTYAFAAQGRPVADLKKIGISRYRYGIEIDAKRTDEAIAAVDGSTVLLGLIAARHFPEGFSFVAAFEGTLMEPGVDRIKLSVSELDGRISLEDTRGARVFGFGPGGKVLFGARAQAGGRLDLKPGKLPQDQELEAFELDPARHFTGDPATWADGGPTRGATSKPVEAAGTKDQEPAGDQGK